jgi:hypothetical protein
MLCQNLDRSKPLELGGSLGLAGTSKKGIAFLQDTHQRCRPPTCVSSARVRSRLKHARQSSRSDRDPKKQDSGRTRGQTTRDPHRHHATSPIPHRARAFRKREKARHSLGKFPPTSAVSANGQERAFPHAHQSVMNLVVYSVMGKKKKNIGGGRWLGHRSDPPCMCTTP